jgi:5'-phosphate synthase pdxT subunit
MQGAFAEHVRALEQVGATAFELRTLEQLDRCDAIVIPGGESTAIRKALDRAGLLDPLHTRIASGLPAFGTCAGMIVLARNEPGAIEPGGTPSCFGVLDIDVQRNGWGRQVNSAEMAIEFDDGARASSVFIRAPRISRLGDGVEVVARIASGSAQGEPVAVRQGTLLAAAFHPELTPDRTLHRRFIDMIDR